MTELGDALRRAAADLEAAGVAFAVVGGLAVSVRGEPRLTRDVDLAVAVADDDEAESLVRALLRSGYRILAQIEQEETGRLATVRFARPPKGPLAPVLDLLFASSGIEAEAVAAASRETVLEGLVLPVARSPHLIAMKTLAFDERRRPQDWDDVRSMLRDATPSDVAETRELLRLIERRGFSRGKDLQARFDSLRA